MRGIVEEKERSDCSSSPGLKRAQLFSMLALRQKYTPLAEVGGSIGHLRIMAVCGRVFYLIQAVRLKLHGKASVMQNTSPRCGVPFFQLFSEK